VCGARRAHPSRGAGCAELAVRIKRCGVCGARRAHQEVQLGVQSSPCAPRGAGEQWRGRALSGHAERTRGFGWAGCAGVHLAGMLGYLGKRLRAAGTRSQCAVCMRRRQVTSCAPCESTVSSACSKAMILPWPASALPLSPPGVCSNSSSGAAAKNSRPTSTHFTPPTLPFERRSHNGAPGQPPFRRVLMFVDNSGADVVLGQLPLARELLRMG